MNEIKKEIENLQNSAQEHVERAHRFARDSFDSSAAQELRYADHDRQLAKWLTDFNVIKNAYDVCQTPEELYNILDEVLGE